jgi:hypothetical protein
MTNDGMTNGLGIPDSRPRSAFGFRHSFDIRHSGFVIHRVEDDQLVRV